ncbi:MAG TPA: hypothetical protein PKD96_03670 [Candidatus Absconditabacterales bacterium]|nr:hypothetical protein [Candidatus Absconditabacterales bacterium]HMT27378.1 hypothetical protein [Candidatus Absconditabacterales bacterium]
MLFNLTAYIEELREKEEKKETVLKYEKFFGPIEGNISDQIWYKEYVQQFETVAYKVPTELQTDFDRKLLMQLVAASYSSEGTLDTQVTEGEEYDFLITVASGDKVVVKKVSELRGFQILRLYEIYVEEQMNLQVLIAEDDAEKKTEEEKTEKAAVLAQRESRVKRRKLVFDTMTFSKETAKANEEKKSQLNDLYNQL